MTPAFEETVIEGAIKELGKTGALKDMRHKPMAVLVARQLETIFPCDQDPPSLAAASASRSRPIKTA